MASAQQNTGPGVVYLIVPGSFTLPQVYDKVVEEVRARGLQADTIGLLSANEGTRLPPPKMEDDAAHIRTAIISVLDHPETPKNVVLTVHSYGGIPGTTALSGLGSADRAAAGKTTAVIGIVYLASFIPAVGESVRSIMGQNMPEANMTGVPGGYMPRFASEMSPFMFNDIESPEEVARLYDGMTAHSSDTFDGQAQYEAWRHIPSTMIIPGKDLICPVAMQEDQYNRALREGANIKKVVLEGAGHCPNISRPKDVVDEMVAIMVRE
jgi:pimeloyl-ACP methyl ester carboxylesterase